jgi:hypothetical protein
MPRPVPFVLLLVALAACEGSPRPGPADTGIALARSKDAKDSLIRVKDSLLAERSRQLSEQSALIGDAATSARLAAQIERDLSEVRSLQVTGDTAQPESAITTAESQLTTVEKKVKLLIARLNASESRVRRMRRDSTAHASYDSTQLARLADYERSIGELRVTVQRQQEEIAALSQRVDSVQRENVVLIAKNDTMTRRNLALNAREDSAFVIMGTQGDLLARGIVRREGGNRLLFGIGRTLVPGRSLKPEDFRVISKDRDLEIQLPRPDKDYRVVSRHSLEFTSAAAVRNATVRGSFTITNPGAFWAPSKYLILVER